MMLKQLISHSQENIYWLLTSQDKANLKMVIFIHLLFNCIKSKSLPIKLIHAYDSYIHCEHVWTREKSKLMSTSKVFSKNIELKFGLTNLSGFWLPYQRPDQRGPNHSLSVYHSDSKFLYNFSKFVNYFTLKLFLPFTFLRLLKYWMCNYVHYFSMTHLGQSIILCMQC